MTASAIPAAKARVAPFTAPVHRQLAALCYRTGAAGREVLLVTSSTGRWILPKGWPITGLRPGQTCLVEAWEEAGVRKGKVARKPLGAFMGSKFSLSATPRRKPDWFASPRRWRPKWRSAGSA